MAVQKTETTADYLGLLRRDENEIDALFDDLLIKVTEFFRDAPVFDALKEKAFAPLVHRRSSYHANPRHFGDPRNSGAPGQGFHFVRITVVPISIPSADHYSVILFEDLADSAVRLGLRTSASAVMAAKASNPETPERHIEHLERELSSTREYLQSTIEELRSTNEEAQAANEELQSSNEELQTAKEELQSSNEELATMNAEVQSRNVQLASANDDLLNLLGSIGTPILMVGNDLCIRRFTPAAERLFHLRPGDVGRPVSDLNPRINVSLDEILSDVLGALRIHEQEVEDFEGRGYLMRIRPYRTGDNRIDGAVLLLIDITDMKRGTDEIRRARDYASAIVETVREPLVVLNEQLVVRSANRAFYEFFRGSPGRSRATACTRSPAGNWTFRRCAGCWTGWWEENPVCAMSKSSSCFTAPAGARCW